MAAPAAPCELPDVPARVNIPSEIYRPLPDAAEYANIVDWDRVDPAAVAGDAVTRLAAALASPDRAGLASCFLPGQDRVYWRDTLALTAHFRTFSGHDGIAAALGHLAAERRVRGLAVSPPDSAVLFTESGPGKTTKFVRCLLEFRTESPRAECRALLMLLPAGAAESDPGGGWKIWTLATWMSGLLDFPIDEARVRAPSAPVGPEDRLVTDTLIVGAGNAGLILASRLKGIGVGHILIDKNDRIGDNWAQRYDCLKFHTGPSYSIMPYNTYPPEAGKSGLTRDELRTQIIRFASELHLDGRVLHRTRIQSTTWDPTRKEWTLELSTEGGGDRPTACRRTVVCKFIVLATGAGYNGGGVPDMPGADSYAGISIHSEDFKNAALLAEQGKKSVIIVGSANAAFDLLEDCHAAGLDVTMIQRSPTYVVPMSHLTNPRGLGMYDSIPTEICDAFLHAIPLAVGGPLIGLVHHDLDSQRPDRYDAVKAAGFKLLDSGEANLVDLLVDRGGGHLIDMELGGVDLIASGQVRLRTGVAPVALTRTGLRLGDGSALEADAIVWCVGYSRSLDGRVLLGDQLGRGGAELATRLEPTWGVDAEGEVRGLWKRQQGVENLWMFAGGTANHRWYSKLIAMQIKGVLEGILPAPYLACH